METNRQDQQQQGSGNSQDSTGRSTQQRRAHQVHSLIRTKLAAPREVTLANNQRQILKSLMTKEKDKQDTIRIPKEEKQHVNRNR